MQTCDFVCAVEWVDHCFEWADARADANTTECEDERCATALWLIGVLSLTSPANQAYIREVRARNSGRRPLAD